MGRFDLNDVRDFARLTMGSAGAVAQTLALAGSKPEDWVLDEGSYKGVKFHVFKSEEKYGGAVEQIQDNGGRRLVKYMFPYRDGQTTDDLGRAPESFEIAILLFGKNYMDGYSKLIQKFNEPTPGDLVHPVRGIIRCKIESWQQVHTFEKRKAVAIRAVFTEHNYSVGDVKAVQDRTAKGALSRLVDMFKYFDKAITNVTGAVGFALSLRNQIIQSLTEVKASYADLTARLNATYNTRGSQDLPGLLPVNSGGTGSLEAGGDFNIAVSPNDPFANIPQGVSDTTLLALATQELAKQVEALRALIAAIILQMQLGYGALQWHDDILNLKSAAIALQDALEKGAASNNSKIINYTVPETKVMSIREIAFANGIGPDNAYEIELLNPWIESVNHIVAGTIVRVPIT